MTETRPDPVDALLAEVAALSAADLHVLRGRWRKLFRKPAPEHLSRGLLARILAYRLQADALGDLSREQVRQLEAIARGLRPRRLGPSAPVPSVSEPRGLKLGAVLVREHEGRLHQVTVVAEGFVWEGRSYRSLSEVARAITGTTWSGPRFFGLTHAPSTRAGVA